MRTFDKLILLGLVMFLQSCGGTGGGGGDGSTSVDPAGNGSRGGTGGTGGTGLVINVNTQGTTSQAQQGGYANQMKYYTVANRTGYPVNVYCNGMVVGAFAPGGWQPGVALIPGTTLDFVRQYDGQFLDRQYYN